MSLYYFVVYVSVLDTFTIIPNLSPWRPGAMSKIGKRDSAVLTILIPYAPQQSPSCSVVIWNRRLNDLKLEIRANNIKVRRLLRYRPFPIFFEFMIKSGEHGPVLPGFR